jgi:Fe-S oxidoreductase
MAFDTLHRLRNAKPLPMVKCRTLAALLDFGACANAAFDHKECCRHEYRQTLRLLEEAGIGSSVAEYLRRLRNLESRRPLPGGDHWQFRRVRLYREAVVRLSLGMVAATASGNRCLDEGICATRCDADLKILFRIVMQCQIIDDVLDYSTDLSAGLPSFLTATKSPSQAFELTRLAALGYADDRDLPRTGDVFALRSALFLVSTCTKLVIVLGHWRQRSHVGQQFTQRPHRLGAEQRVIKNHDCPGNFVSRIGA